MEEKDSYYRVRAYIHQEALRANLQQIRRTIGPGPKIMAVIKANGYGHGVENLLPVLEEEQVAAYAVAVVEEGIRLRELGVTKPILLLGFTAPSDAPTLVQYDLSATVFTLAMAEHLSQAAAAAGKTARVHIALDTGMSRIGFPCTSESVEVIRQIQELPALRIEGMFTHYARADEADKTAARRQLARYNEMYQALTDAGVVIPVRHTSNSAAIMELPEAHFEMVRAGIILYGLTPSEEMDTQAFPLHPVMELKTHVVYIKQIEAGDAVSYGCIFRAETPMRIATVACGYGDGYHRAATGGATVLIHGQRAPIVGRICMDQMMADVTDIPGVKAGDTAVLLGEDGSETVTAEDIARWSGTISYEVLLAATGRVHREWRES